MTRVATMILCAGLGTRLRPLSDICAKPLVPVGDRPALAHVVQAVLRAGASRVVVNAHHRASDVRDFAEAHAGVSVSDERELLGTAGGVHRARTLLGAGDVLVWNGDILLFASPPLDVAGLVASHAPSTGATLVVRPGPWGTGNVGIDAEGKIVRLRRVTVREGEASGGEFLGIHVLGAALRAKLPERGCLVGDVYIPALHAGAELSAFTTEIPFYDIGTVASYLDANLAWLAARGDTSWIAAGASIASGVDPRGSVIGAGATVTGEGLLDRCVVWPGAHARAPLACAVVTPDDTLRL